VHRGVVVATVQLHVRPDSVGAAPPVHLSVSPRDPRKGLALQRPSSSWHRFAVAEYIEVFYNRKRMHSSIDYRTPAQALNDYQTAAQAA